MIASFRGETRWLSNFATVGIVYNGIIYSSTETAFQAQKTLNDDIRGMMAVLSPAEAKEEGMKIKLRSDWDNVKINIMYEINKLKFNQEPFKSKLLATGDQELIEGNDWNDTFWGVCKSVGENHLGKILMRIRKELNDNK